MKKTNATNSALKISIAFLVASLFYIYLSDHLILMNENIKTIAEATYFQTIKGSLYVFTFAVFLFFLSRYYLKKFKNAHEELESHKSHLEEEVKDRTHELEKKTLKLKISQQSLKEMINELNETTGKLREANYRLERSNKELESFSYTVSHDLRAPLRSVNGFSQALLEDYSDKLDATGVDYLKRVHDNARKMEILIDEILKLSRISNRAVKFEKVDISQLARAIESDLREVEKNRKIKINIENDLCVKGDYDLLKILMFNLMENAFKFTKNTTDPAISVGKKLIEGRDVIFIQDNGAGFDAKYAEKLFEPFQRLHSDEQYPGTGIGLATVNKIVSRHKGLIWAEGEINKGATFYLYLD